MKNSLQAYRCRSDLPLHRLVKGTLGRMLSPLLPEYAETIRRFPFRYRLNRAGRLIRNSYFLKAVEEKDHEAVRDLLRDYWSSQMSDEFYTGLSHRYETLFLRYQSSNGKLRRIYEDFGFVFHSEWSAPPNFVARYEYDTECAGDV